MTTLQTDCLEAARKNFQEAETALAAAEKAYLDGVLTNAEDDNDDCTTAMEKRAQLARLEGDFSAAEQRCKTARVRLNWEEHQQKTNRW